MSTQSHRTRWNWSPVFFVGPFLLLFSVFVVWPLISSLILAFQQTYGPGTTIWVGFRNFSYLVSDVHFWTAVSNTAIFTLGSLFIQLPVSLGLALLLNHPKLVGRSWLRLIFFSPSLVGLPFVAILFSPIFEKRIGLLNVALHALTGGWWNPEFAWLQEYVMPALILAALWIYAGFNMIYFLAALQNVPKELTEAAEMDGCNAWGRFWHVTLPEIRPVAGFVTLLSVIASFQIFELSLLLLNNIGGESDRGLTIVMYLYQTGFITGDLGYASAVGWVLAMVLMAITLLHRKITKAFDED